MSNIVLRPTYWASFSGGKDSLYMLYYILHNLDKYPLDGVVHYELEMDYPFIKDVVNYVEKECKKYNIAFFRIRPRKTWKELYDRYLYPTRKSRWCNSHYKLDCLYQLKEMMKEQGKKVISYIGFCADEAKRFKSELFSDCTNVSEIYPLAEAGIEETTILEWAKEQPIFNGYYLSNNRCGCMGCPMSTLRDLVYLRKHYPEQYEYVMSKAEETETIRNTELGKRFSVWSSNPKYDTKYRRERVATIIENEKNQIVMFEEETE